MIDDAAALSFVSSDLLSWLENGRPVTMDKLRKVLDGLGLGMLVLPAGEAAVLMSELQGMRAGSPSSGNPPKTGGRDD